MRQTALVLLAVVLMGCPKKEEAPKAAPPAPIPPPASANPSTEVPKPALPKEAEAEFMGTWSAAGVEAAKFVFTVQLEPCTPLAQKPTRFGETVFETPGKFFSEHFVPQGTLGHVCLFGLDEKGTVVAAGGWEKNPQKLEGAEDLIFDNIVLTMAPVR